MQWTNGDGGGIEEETRSRGVCHTVETCVDKPWARTAARIQGYLSREEGYARADNDTTGAAEEA